MMNCREEESGGTVSATAISHPARWAYFILPALYMLMIALGPLFSWWALAEDGRGPDANIGFGMGFFWTTFWGLPWSLWWVVNSPNSEVSAMAIYIGCGLINVALTSGFMVWLRRRVAREYYPRHGSGTTEQTAPQT
jgi:bacteriorhodopsin